jgi:hypothetical protein
MTDQPIQIRKPRVAEAIRKLAARRGVGITDAVAEAVDDALRRLDRVDEAEMQRRLARIRRAVDEFNALPVVGRILTDDDLYDEDGFPK